MESPEICVHNTQSLRVEPVAKDCRKSKQQASSSTPVLIAREARPQAADLIHESEPLDVCDAEEVRGSCPLSIQQHLRQLSHSSKQEEKAKQHSEVIALKTKRQEK